MNREPVRIAAAIQAGWLVLLGGSAFTDLFPKSVVGLLVLATAAVQAAVGEYTRSRVTPVVPEREIVRGQDGAVSGATICLAIIAAVVLLSWLGVDGHLG